LRISRESGITLVVFFVLLIACTAVGYWLLFRLGRATPVMLSVGVATILTCLIRKKDLATLGWGGWSWKYQWLSYLVPLLIAFIAYLIIWVAGFGGWYNAEFVLQQMQDYNLSNWSNAGVIAFHLLLTATYSFVLLLPSVLGEEIGWRGFLVPELARFMSFTGVALTSGLIWSVWHWPMMFKGFYGNDVTPLYYQLFFFTLLIVSYAVIMTYLRFKTDSLWTAVIFHMSGNVFLQKVFTPLTIENESSAWYVDEFGAVPALVAFAFAILFWRKGKSEFGDLSRWKGHSTGAG
jgi:membrane protease YdiL (CAAX protease family)